MLAAGEMDCESGCDLSTRLDGGSAQQLRRVVIGGVERLDRQFRERDLARCAEGGDRGEHSCDVVTDSELEWENHTVTGGRWPDVEMCELRQEA